MTTKKKTTKKKANTDVALPSKKRVAEIRKGMTPAQRRYIGEAQLVTIITAIEASIHGFYAVTTAKERAKPPTPRALKATTLAIVGRLVVEMPEELEDP